MLAPPLFPFQVIGTPLGLRKVIAAQLQPVMDSVASKLQPWCAKILKHGCRTILVQTTLYAIPIHAMILLDFPRRSLKRFLRSVGPSFGKGGVRSMAATAWSCGTRWTPLRPSVDWVFQISASSILHSFAGGRGCRRLICQRPVGVALS
jgi:hypothetical protein